MEEKKQILMQCYHCGNKGLLNVIAQHKDTDTEFAYDEYGNKVGIVFQENMVWSMVSCPVCNMISVYKEYWNSCEHSKEDTVVYPTSNFNNLGVPKNISKAFEAALKVKQIDSAICLLSLRRTLEVVCKDKGAKGKDLESKIKDLIERGVFPSVFEDACWVIRQLGNNAAHADESIFYTNEVNEVISFVELILEYTYSAPLKMKELRKRIEKQKKIGITNKIISENLLK